MNIFYLALEQTIVFLPLVMGIYLSYKILQTTDLTVDGTFVLGAALYARSLSMGVEPLVAVLIALAGGFLGGVMVSLIQFKDKVNSLIASILALFILYSVNFQVMGRANISLQDNRTLIYLFGDQIILFMCLISIGLVVVILSSQLGLKLRGFGANKSLMQKITSNIEKFRMLGLGFSNMLAAFCGVLTAEVNGYADINMGFGMALTGIGSVVIGLDLIRRVYRSRKIFNVGSDILGCFLGGLTYFLSLNTLLRIGIEPINLKLVLGVILVMLLRGVGSSPLNKIGVNRE